MPYQAPQLLFEPLPESVATNILEAEGLHARLTGRQAAVGTR